MAVRDDFTAGEVLAAADLNDTFASKLDLTGGKILQIVRATDGTQRSTTSTSFVDITGMSVTITPQTNTSAVIIIATCMGQADHAGQSPYMHFRISDSSNNAISGAQDGLFGMNNTERVSGQTQSSFLLVTQIGYATPATTSATTYKWRFRSAVGNTVYVQNATQTGQMFAIEVSA